MSKWYLVLGLTVVLFEEVSAAGNCTENCALCHNGCFACNEGYYKIDGKCEQCNPNCERCYSTGLCYFECKDGWYGLSCAHACTCSYGICDRYTGSCPYQTDPPDSSSHDHEDYDDDVYAGKVLGILALPLGMVVICCCAMKRKKNPDGEADDTTDIIPPSQKLLPGQTPITTRSANLTYPNFFAGNNVMGPPQRWDFAPSPCSTYSGQQTDIAPPLCTTYSGQQTDQTPSPTPCPTYSGQQTGQTPSQTPCPTYSGQQRDSTPPSCATYSDQQTDSVPSPCPTYSGEQTDIGLPPAYTARTNMPPPPSYESLFDTKKEHIDEPFT
ncbi:scavenger receptor class F member 2-like [Haliotis asinina]|uniref:scavenger receptor class F member 2-like n=1 Tax=Haliotis asinina TaxID=109174 RepID=UPI0035322F46